MIPCAVPSAMSTVVSVKNRTKTSFQATTVVFSELEARMEEFWHSKISESVIERESKVIFGKMVHPTELKSGANFIVNLLLTVADSNALINVKENFISLKTRLKGTKTGATVYSCACSFPETTNITKPVWRKGGDKNVFLCKINTKIFSITYSGTWNDNITFTLEDVNNVPAFLKYPKRSVENEIVDEIFENEWKQHNIGAVKYNHSHVNVLDRRPPFSTINGNSVPSMDQFMPPCPWWAWLDEWHIDNSFGNKDGWLYLDNWQSEIPGEPNSTKMRIRRWIRKRIFTKEPSKLLTNLEKNLLKEFHNKHSNEVYESLSNFIAPFLKELRRDVTSNIEKYDLGSLAAIPSPKLRRFIKT